MLTKMPPEKLDARRMREMFHAVAPRYDLVTRVFSYGMDAEWKREAVRRAVLPPGAVVLDLASGTGDFSRLVAEAVPGADSIAVDLTFEMLRLARDGGVRRLVSADALCLPFADEAFDAAFVGYGMRNFPDLARALAEIRRVLRPGGRLVTLDFFLPQRALLKRIYLGYLYLQGAVWGLVLHRRPRVYTYIPDSLRSFETAAGFATLLRDSGYTNVAKQEYIGGGIAVHWAIR